jgi:hypothetical protein
VLPASDPLKTATQPVGVPDVGFGRLPVRFLLPPPVPPPPIAFSPELQSSETVVLLAVVERTVTFAVLNDPVAPAGPAGP